MPLARKLKKASSWPQASARRRNVAQTQVRAFLAQQEAKQAKAWCSGKGSELREVGGAWHGSAKREGKHGIGPGRRGARSRRCRDAKLQASHQLSPLGCDTGESHAASSALYATVSFVENQQIAFDAENGGIICNHVRAIAILHSNTFSLEGSMADLWYGIITTWLTCSARSPVLL